MEILSRLLENGFAPGIEVQYTLDQSMMVVKVPDFDKAFDVATGPTRSDEIIPGISFANSETGLLAFCIEAYFYRLICTNGLIAKVASNKSRFKHISTRAMEQFPDALSHVIKGAQHRQVQLIGSRNTHVEDPMAAIALFSKQFGLSQTETEVVRQAYYLEQGATMFHIINAFTRAAQEAGLSPVEAYRYEKAGGRILGMVQA